MAKKRRKRKTLTVIEAIARVNTMIERIDVDVRTGSRVEQVLEEGNKIVGCIPVKNNSHAATYNCIKQSLVMNLAMTVARLYDNGSRRFSANDKDIASIPLMIRLVKQKRCQKKIIETAFKNWFPVDTSEHFKNKSRDDAKRAIEKAIQIYEERVSSARHRHYKTLLKRLRDSELAHSKLEEYLDRKPTYNQLFHLMDAARDITELVALAVRGNNIYYSELVVSMNSNANKFWNKALKS